MLSRSRQPRRGRINSMSGGIGDNIDVMGQPFRPAVIPLPNINSSDNSNLIVVAVTVVITTTIIIIIV